LDLPLIRNPVSCGASVVGLQYEDGIVIAADHLASFGSMARFRACPRVHKVNDNTIIGCGGDYADFQTVWRTIEQKQVEEEAHQDGHNLGPKSLHNWLTRLQYNKRCKFDPYWIEWVVGGFQDGKPYLGYVDKLGTSYQDKAIGTGRLGVLAIPLLRDYTENFTIKLDKEKARAIMIKALETLFYRDAYTFPKYHIGFVTQAEGAQVEGPFELQTNWNAALLVKGYE
jgi:20S proteasome subunit beta 7